MANKKSDLTSPVFVEKAQAGSSPELSPVIQEMKNGIDIQPLENIQKSEYISFKDNSLRDDNSKDNINSDENKIPFFKRRIVALGIVVVLICVAFFGAYTALFHLDDFSHGAVAVYQKGSIVNVLLENDNIIELENVNHAQLSNDGKTLVYSQDTSSKTGKYDIRVIEFTKRSSVKNEGSVIVSGIDSNWSTGNDAAFVYYTKTQNKTTKYYAYNTVSRQTNLIVSDALEFFTPPKGDIIYYTRDSSSGPILYRVRFGEEPEAISNVSNVKGFSNEDLLEIIYTVKEENEKATSHTLYKITGDKSAVKIAENVSEVYLDDYEVGGNLYYFVKMDAKLNWKDFVNDSYEEHDISLKEPDKGDFLVTRGFIFKSTKVDETAYSKAMQNYKKKLLRDEIREALNKLDLGLAVSSEYQIKVFDGSKSKELASGVKLENILAFAKNGAPRIIYSKTKIDSSQKTSIDKLYEIAAQKTVNDSVDFVINSLENDFEVVNGVKYSWYNGNNILEYDINPSFSIAKSSFFFGGRDRFFVAVKTDEIHFDLLYSSIKENEVSQSVAVASNVTAFNFKNDNLYFNVDSQNNTNDLYVFTKDGKTNLICEDNVQYFLKEADEVLALKAVSKNGVLWAVDIFSYDSTESKSLDKNVSYKHFVIDEDAFAYIKDYKTAAASDNEASVGGTMYIYSQGKIKEIDTEVTDILDINFKLNNK